MSAASTRARVRARLRADRALRDQAKFDLRYALLAGAVGFLTFLVIFGR